MNDSQSNSVSRIAHAGSADMKVSYSSHAPECRHFVVEYVPLLFRVRKDLGSNLVLRTVIPTEVLCLFL
jgi:hypothetical protein